MVILTWNSSLLLFSFLTESHSYIDERLVRLLIWLIVNDITHLNSNLGVLSSALYLSLFQLTCRLSP